MAIKENKKKNAGGGLYIALAICVLSVICIGVYSAVINIFDASKALDQDTTMPSSKAPTVVVEAKRQEEQTPDDTPAPDNNPAPLTPEETAPARPQPTTFTMPVAGVPIKEFSNDILVYSDTMNDYRLHTGIDLAATPGTAVKAFTDGVVQKIYEDPLMGQTIVIDHGGDMKSVYQNLSETLPDGIREGVEVKEGQVIAGVGETCLIEIAEEPHLHFEVMQADHPVDPMEFFK